MSHPLAALTLGLFGTVGSTVATFASTHGTNLGPWAQVGGTATAVGALAYVAKLLADGRLVAQPVAEMAAKADKREEQLVDLLDKHAVLVQDSHERETDLRHLFLNAHRDNADRERDVRSERDRERQERDR